MAYRNSGYKRSTRKRTGRTRYGSQQAMEHVQQAKKLTAELGGVDGDVKKYFFSLDGAKLKEVLDAYEEAYGKKARDYAEYAIPKWQKGSVKMSGMVAERLFSLLPPLMPLQVKHELAESLWRHVSPSSKRTIYYGPEVDLYQLRLIIEDHFFTTAVPHSIPDSIQSRFEWLASGDIATKQQLLNHFIGKEKELVALEVKEKASLLLNAFNNKDERSSFRSTLNLAVGKNEVSIIFDERIQGISDNPPSHRVKSSSDGIILGFFRSIKNLIA